MNQPIELPEIAEEEQTPLVRRLLAIIEQLAARVAHQEEQLEHLKDEVAVLKNKKQRPKFTSSRMDEKTEPQSNEGKGKRPGSEKRSKTEHLKIDEEIPIAPETLPEGSTFKGYQDFVVQDLVIRTHTVRYRLERWQAPDGSAHIGRLPEAVRGGHYGPGVVSYILYQHHHCHVTQPLLREQLSEWGIDISRGQLNRLLSEGKEAYHEEKQALLTAGLQSSGYVTVDDTGARQAGKNGYCTQIGNEWFAWFASTESKSRINFLELLRTGHTDHVLDEAALSYMKSQGLPSAPLNALRGHGQVHWVDRRQWDEHLSELGITRERHIRLATEGTLIGSVLAHGLPEALAIVSDDAGQFNVFVHGLCWIHTERLIHKILPLNEVHRQALDAIRERLWSLYGDLKAYKIEPSEEKKAELSKRFDAIFTTKTGYRTLNLALRRIHRHRNELLLVLERPEIPLHTNGSETDIRDYVKKKKVSGGTRSELGRQCRDTFASLKKTCRKLGISFWRYLLDRQTGTRAIPSLPDLIQHKAAPDR
jgi:hypothetical protein